MVGEDRPIRFYGLTDVGKRREHNEDAFHFSESDFYGIVADGMGGRNYGEVASRMVVDTVRDRFDTFFPDSVRSIRHDQSHCVDMVRCLLDDWIRDANTAVWKKGQSDEKYREMGTTLVMVYALPTIALVAHIGDSRVYHLHGEELSQITHDHSFVNSQVDSGAMSPEEAQSSTQKNIITRAIGTSRHVKPEFKTPHVAHGDRLLLCSDGLTDMVTDEVILDILLSESRVEKVAESLVAEANANGGRDNITVLLVDYE